LGTRDEGVLFEVLQDIHRGDAKLECVESEDARVWEVAEFGASSGRERRLRKDALMGDVGERRQHDDSGRVRNASEVFFDFCHHTFMDLFECELCRCGLDHRMMFVHEGTKKYQNVGLSHLHLSQ